MNSLSIIKKGFTYRCRQQQVVGHSHQVVRIQEKRVCRPITSSSHVFTNPEYTKTEVFSMIFVVCLDLF